MCFANFIQNCVYAGTQTAAYVYNLPMNLCPLFLSTSW